MKKNMLRIIIIGGVLYGIFVVSLIGQNINAQTSITAMEQSIEKRKIENKDDGNNNIEWGLMEKPENNIYELVYARTFDLDGDNKLEMLKGFKGYDQHKQLRIYKLQGDKFSCYYKLDYDSFSVGDLDKDGTLEIASIIRIDEETPYVKLQVHSISENTYKVEHEVKCEDGSYPDNVEIGAISEDQQAIFVDLGIGAHSGLTEIIIKEDGEYKNVLSYDKDTELHPAFKPYPLLSKDINYDGIIEVGIQSMPPGTENLPMAAIPWINNWYRWDGEDGLNLVMEEFTTGDYQFVIPQNWHDKYTIDKDLEESMEFYSVQFVYLSEDNEKTDLLTLHSIPKEDWDEHEDILQNEYILLGESRYNNVLLAELPSDNVGLPKDKFQEYEAMLLNEEGLRNYFYKAQEQEILEKLYKEITEIEEQFFDMLFSPETVKNSTEVKDYQSKEDLINDVSQIADKELVTKYVDNYYEEKGDKLYIIAQGMPTKILFDSYYGFNQIDENTYEIVQIEANVMMGAYKLMVTFTNKDNCWLMIDRTTELRQLSDDEFMKLIK